MVSTVVKCIPPLNYYRVYGYSGENKSSEIEGDITLSFPAPTNLTAYPISDSEIGLIWIDNCSFEKGYKIERRENEGNFIQISELSSNTTEFIDSGLIYSSNYYYRVKAFLGLNYSNYSNEAFASPYKVKNITQWTYHKNIQTAILSSINGDTIIVKPGIYAENINFYGKNITLGSMFIVTVDTNYIHSTITDGNNNGSVFKFENGEDSTAILNGVKIINGYAQGGWNEGCGGGIYCNNLSSPKLKNLIINGNNADKGGGGIYCSGSLLKLINSKVIGNTATFGGGIFFSYSSFSLTVRANFKKSGSIETTT